MSQEQIVICKFNQKGFCKFKQYCKKIMKSLETKVNVKIENVKEDTQRSANTS